MNLLLKSCSPSITWIFERMISIVKNFIRAFDLPNGSFRFWDVLKYFLSVILNRNSYFPLEIKFYRLRKENFKLRYLRIFYLKNGHVLIKYMFREHSNRSFNRSLGIFNLIPFHVVFSSISMRVSFFKCWCALHLLIYTIKYKNHIFNNFSFSQN